MTAAVAAFSSSSRICAAASPFDIYFISFLPCLLFDTGLHMLLAAYRKALHSDSHLLLPHWLLCIAKLTASK